MRRLNTVLAGFLAWCVTCAAAGQAPQAGTDVAADFVAATPLEPFPAPLAAAAAGITTEALAAHVAFLASPSLAGRGLGDRGLDAALEYVAASLALAGVAPPDEGGRFQTVPVREIGSITGEVSVTRRSGEQGLSRVFSAGADCLLPAVPPQRITAGVVFAGHGIREPKLGHDDTRGLAVRGKIVLLVGGLPAGPQWRTKELQGRYDAEDLDDRYTARVELARALGAVAVLAVEPDDWPALVQRGAAPSRAFVPFDRDIDPDGPPLVRVSPAVAEALLGASAPPDRSLRAERPRALPGVTATIEVRGSERLLTSRNVFGGVRGGEPGLADEVVMLGAHVDHLGCSGDVVYPGADDNASGVAALLEIARAFAASPSRPKRTLLFAFWTGEEEGKLGSGYYVHHPLRPLLRTTYLNLDMIGHPWSAEEIRTLVTGAGLPAGDEFLATVTPADFVEPGLPSGAQQLDASLRRAARGTGLALHFDRTDGTHGGSDYRDFARAGVPFVRFFGNFHPAYHEPGDTAEALDCAQVQRVARLALATAWLLADR